MAPERRVAYCGRPKSADSSDGVVRQPSGEFAAIQKDAMTSKEPLVSSIVGFLQIECPFMGEVGMTQRDIELVERWVARGDQEAFKEIVRRYAGLVYGTCKRVLRNEVEAEDVTQECFVQLATIPPKIHSSLGGWLYTQATRCSLHRIRADRRRRERERQFVESRPKFTETAWDDVQPFVDEVISELPERFRGPIISHFLENQTHEAIAGQLGITRSAVTHRINKGILEARRMLKRRNVPMATVALTAMLRAGMSEAAPASLCAALVESAVSGAAQPKHDAPETAQPNPPKTRGASATLKKVCAGIVVALLLVLGTGHVTPRSHTRPHPQQTAHVVQPEARRTDANAWQSPDADIADRGTNDAGESMAGDVDGHVRKPHGVLEGRVIDMAGSPVEGATVEARHCKSGVEGETTTAADGTFALDIYLTDEGAPLAAEAGEALVGVWATHREYKWRTVLWDVPLNARGINLVFAQGEIRGQVIDAVTGEPIEQFELRVQREASLYGGMTTPDYPWSAFDSPDGQFVLPTRYETTAIEVRAEGFGHRAFHESHVCVGEGEILEDVVLRLQPGWNVSGLVLDAATREAIEGAHVGIGLKKTLKRRGIRAEDFDAITGPDGRFLIEGRAITEQVNLRVFHPAYAPEYALGVDTGTAQETEVMLSRGGVLRGTVLDNGQPVADLFVSIVLAYGLPSDGGASPLVYRDYIHDSGGSGNEDVYQADVYTSEDGSYEIAGVSPGGYELGIARVGMEDNLPHFETLAKAWVEIENGATAELVHELEDYSIISGRVSGVNDYDGVVVELCDARHPSSTLYTNTGRNAGIGLDGTGGFCFPLVPAGDYVVRGLIRSPGDPGQETEQPCTVSYGEMHEVALDF